MKKVKKAALAADEKKEVDASKLYLAGLRGLVSVEEKLVLELAGAYQDLEPCNAVVTIAAQERAARYFNAHGFVETLEHMLKTQGLSRK